MILLWLILIPFVGGLLAWLLARWNASAPRWISLIAAALDLVIALALWAQHYRQVGFSPHGPWLVQWDQPWVPQWGISFHLGMDGLSLLLVMLTAFLGIMAVVCSWTEIQERVGMFHFSLMWVISGISGVFLALDLFLFYFFWEMMLVPMYFLIAIWGHERRIYASVKFFLFTQASGLLMLLAILGLYFIHGRETGVYTFDYLQLLHTPLPASAAGWLMLGFFIAFAVKLPAVPVHTWLPDAHTEAPTAGSVILAGLLLKTGAYGLLRFVVPLFPRAAFNFAPVAMALGVAGILYGALLAFAQTDLKRLVAYTSVSHMGFVLLGVFAWNELALQGAVMQMLCHGIATGALFILVGSLQERTHTRDMRRLGGLWDTVPRMGGIGLFFALASLGLPGLGNFVGEFLTLVGAYAVSILFTVLAALGLIASTVYALWMIQLTFYGPNKEGWKLPDFSGREMAMMTALIAAIIWLGLAPQAVLNTAKPALVGLQAEVGSPQVARRGDGGIGRGRAPMRSVTAFASVGLPDVPEGQPETAQAFMPGDVARNDASPGGTNETSGAASSVLALTARRRASAVPPGLGSVYPPAFPGMNAWAIFGQSLRDESRLGLPDGAPDQVRRSLRGASRLGLPDGPPDQVGTS